MDPEPVGATATIAEIHDRIRRRVALDPAATEEDTHGDVARLLAELAGAREERWLELVPARFRNARLVDLSDTLAATARQWVDGGMTSNVLLLGPTGVGKSHAAVAMLRAAFNAGRTIRFAPIVEMLEGLRPDGDDHLEWSPYDVDVLVIDDVGTEKRSDWTDQVLDAIVNRRWLDKLPTIATSNLEPQVLADVVGPRMWSRLYDGAIRYTIGGVDRRLAS